MGWFWRSSNNDQDDKDPLRNLDPSLREFLKKESPIKYKSSSSSSSSPTGSDSRDINNTKNESKPLPPYVFMDGRYGYLWKSYQSPEEIDSHMKSDQEKIDEILEGFKYRKMEIGKAALENCALEQVALSDCWTNGSARARLTLCREENKAFNRCHTMQSALGYLSSFDRPAEVDEQIQMHADTLYHRMLDEEKSAELARAQGKPVPVFPALLSQNLELPLNPQVEAARKDVGDVLRQPSDLKESVRKQLKKRLENLTPAEREIEEQAIRAEIRAGESLGGNLTGIYEEQEEQRMIRKEQGKETIGDKLISIFGFGK